MTRYYISSEIWEEKKEPVIISRPVSKKQFDEVQKIIHGGKKE